VNNLLFAGGEVAVELVWGFFCFVLFCFLTKERIFLYDYSILFISYSVHQASHYIFLCLPPQVKFLDTIPYFQFIPLLNLWMIRAKVEGQHLLALLHHLHSSNCVTRAHFSSLKLSGKHYFTAKCFFTVKWSTVHFSLVKTFLSFITQDGKVTLITLRSVRGY